METMIKVLVALSKDAKTLVKGSEARERIEKVLEENAKTLRAQWGKSDKKSARATWREAGVHEVVISLVVRVIWPPEKPETHKLNAREAKAVLALIPADPAEARAWLRGLVDLVKSERPFPKGE